MVLLLPLPEWKAEVLPLTSILGKEIYRPLGELGMCPQGFGKFVVVSFAASSPAALFPVIEG